MTPFNFIFYFNICNVTVCNIHTFPSWKMYNLVFHRKVFKSRVLSETNWSSLGGEILSPLRWMQVVSRYLTCLPLCLFSLVFWLMLLTVRQIQRGVLWLGQWSSVERLSVWKNTHMNILCRWQWVCLRRVNCWKKKSRNYWDCIRSLLFCFGTDSDPWAVPQCWASVKSSSADGRIVLSPAQGR